MESNNQQKDGFRYTYSAKDQEEIRSIRQKYVPREEDKMERLRRLDRVLYEEVRAVLQSNKDERHLRGGAATRHKYHPED